jgi:DnaJ family protein A protein 2
MIEGEGMPYYGNPFTKGRLFVRFIVDFPDSIPAEQIAAIVAALPKAPQVKLTGEEEECALTAASLREFGQDSGGSDGRGSAYEDDDDDEDGSARGGRQVQCQNM